MICQQDVSDFKLRYCDENPIIARMLSQQLNWWVQEPILDVGAGVGDISESAFLERNVILLDRLDFSGFPAKHPRVQADFFDVKPTSLNHPQTLLFSHVLQFLDEETLRLNAQVQCFEAPKIVTVTNTNNGLLGKVLDWAHRNLRGVNAETNVPGFPPGYAIEYTHCFTGRLACPNFPVLTRQITYILDTVPSEEERAALEEFLRANLTEPNLPIKQEIRAFRLI